MYLLLRKFAGYPAKSYGEVSRGPAGYLVVYRGVRSFHRPRGLASQTVAVAGGAGCRVYVEDCWGSVGRSRRHGVFDCESALLAGQFLQAGGWET